MKDILKSLFIFILGILFLIGVFLLGRITYKAPPFMVDQADTTSTIDTTTVVKPEPKDSTIIKYVYIRLPALPVPDDSVPASQDSVPVPDDSVLVSLPIERKVYEEDSLYRVVVSGHNVSLDSLTIFPTTTTIMVYKTVPADKPRRWSFGITAGLSVLVTPSGVVHSGLGITGGISFFF